MTLELLFSQSGLVFLGVCRPRYERDWDRFSQWLNSEKRAGLDYLQRHSAIRKNPEQLLPGSKSVIVFGLPYYFENTAPAARYAQFRDYHKMLRKMGRQVFESYLRQENLKGIHFRVAVDSAPILERALAVHAGHGFVGKNTCFIHPERGSFLLLAEIFSTLELPVSASGEDLPDCGTCTLCQTACPTDALQVDYVLDASRCLSYWTIEHRGEIPAPYAPFLKESFFGCDICQNICPYNRQGRNNELPAWIEKKRVPPLQTVAEMGEPEYQKEFSGTPFTRAKMSGLKRNARLALRVLSETTR